jgi:hypothetical protein
MSQVPVLNPGWIAAAVTEVVTVLLSVCKKMLVFFK